MVEKKKSRKIVSLIFILVMLFILGGIIVFLNRDTIFKEERASLNDDINVEKVNEEVKIKDKVTLNSGDHFTIEDFFIDDIELTDVEATFVNRDDTVSEKELVVTEANVVISVGTFDVTIKLGDKIYTSVLEVLDKTEPVLEVKDILVIEGNEVTKDSFVVSCEDNSKKECIIKITSFDGKEVEIDKSVGTRKYFIVASDNSGNEVKKEVKLTVLKKEESSNKKDSHSSNNDSSHVSSKKVVSTRNETEESYEEANYGTKYKVTKTIKVTTYSDGTEARKTTKTSKKLDASGFKATSKELESEARSVTNSNYSAYQEMTTYVNQYREEVGSKDLTLNKELSVLATIRAIEIAYSDTFSHTRPDGRHWGTVGEDLNFAMMILGENILYGTGGYSDTAAKAATQWRDSPGHYRNMIASGFGTLGVGKYTLNGTTYWVQLFCG